MMERAECTCMAPGLKCHGCVVNEYIAELEEQVKLADRLINGWDDHWGMSQCLDGYYGECFTDDLNAWDRLKEQKDED